MLSKFEFIFCLISLLFAIGVGLYYGGRSFYYYSLQNKEYKETSSKIYVIGVFDEYKTKEDIKM